MYLTDLNGQQIEITDLAQAIQQAQDFKEYRHVDGSFSELNDELSAYWRDMHQKLLQLQSKLKI